MKVKDMIEQLKSLDPECEIVGDNGQPLDQFTRYGRSEYQDGKWVVIHGVAVSECSR